jgi:hypothetical protein
MRNLTSTQDVVIARYFLELGTNLIRTGILVRQRWRKEESGEHQKELEGGEYRLHVVRSNARVGSGPQIMGQSVAASSSRNTTVAYVAPKTTVGTVCVAACIVRYSKLQSNRPPLASSRAWIPNDALYHDFSPFHRYWGMFPWYGAIIPRLRHSMKCSDEDSPHQSDQPGP